MFIYQRHDVFVQEFGHQFNDRWMDTTSAEAQGVQSCQHGSANTLGVNWISRAGGMAADQIVLELNAFLILYSVLRHRSKSGIDTINNFVFRKFFEKIKTVLYPFCYIFVKLDGLVVENNLFNFIDLQISFQYWH